MNTIKIRHPHTKMIAHRGLSGLERENSAAAFIAAGNRSYFGTECDLHLSKDDVFVVCHDDNLKRVAGVDCLIRDTLLQDIKQIPLYEVRSTVVKDYLRVPTLLEYLEISQKYQKCCVIEIKPELTMTQTKALLTEIRNFGYLHQVIFISFRFANLEKLSQLDSSLRLQFLTSKITEEVINKCINLKISLDANYQSLTFEHVKAFQNAGLEVNVWTVDDVKVARKLIRWVVDYITTNILE